MPRPPTPLFALTGLMAGLMAGSAAAQEPGTFSHAAEEVVLGEVVAEGACAGRRKLTHPLAFFETETRSWEAPAWTPDLPGCVGTTDGASIPLGLQTLVGDPFDPDILRAAIIHDHYVYPEREGVRPWLEVVRAFEAGLRASGVSAARRNAMYYAVYTFGPYWTEDVTKDGVLCSLARSNCYQSREGRTIVHEPGTLTTDAAVEAVKAFARTRRAGEDLSAEEIEAIAAARHPDEVAARRAFMAASPPPRATPLSLGPTAQGRS